MFGSGPASGMEMMLKSMGLGEVIDAAKKLASEGTVQKIVAFGEGLEELNARLSRIEASLLHLSGSGQFPGVAGELAGVKGQHQPVSTGNDLRSASEPASDADDGGPILPGSDERLGLPDQDRRDRSSGGADASRRTANSRDG